MKKLLLTVLMICLLSACASDESNIEDEFLAWRDGIGDISCTAVITITQENAVSEYELQCDYADENYKVTIISPENIAGITASKNGEETNIEYDGLMLSLGELGDMTPINAMPTMIDALKSAHIDMCYAEENDETKLNVFELVIDEVSKIRIWCISETMTPIHAEFESNGYTGIKAEITNWNLE